MAVTRVNTATISATGTTASSINTTLGIAAAVGDLIVVTMCCNGTHVTNGMSFSDGVNGAYTTLKEQDLSAGSSRWEQTFYKIVTAATASTTSLVGSPYAANTSGAYVVDIFRGTGGTISQPVVGASPAAGSSFAAPALAVAPAAGDLVLSLVTIAASTLTKPAAFTQGSTVTTGPSAANGYVLSADGSSTYGGTWTSGSVNSNAAETVAFSGSAAAPSPAARRLSDRRYAPMRSAVY